VTEQRRRAGWLAAVVIGAWPHVGGAHDGASHGTEAAETQAVPRAEASPGARLYEPPVPGTYRLPSIQRVADHRLLGAGGAPEPIVRARDGATVVAFIYRGCSDVNGCPLSLSVLQTLDRELAAQPELAARARLVTVSFDPEHDTPEAMEALRAGLAPRGQWAFLTAASRAALAPVLADYRQDASVAVGEDGAPTGLIGHVLKVFLVDGERRVRNIYSIGYLDADVIRGDIETVLGEASVGGEASRGALQAAEARTARPALCAAATAAPRR
jgi:cytochrome c peroxidase